MTGRLLPAGFYGFEHVSVSDRIETGTEVVTASMIDAFAGLTGDRFEIHMSREGAARHGFSARVAHGLLVLSLVDGLKNRCAAQFRARASLGWEVSFLRPVLAGDAISARITVAEKRKTRKPDQGILRLVAEAVNQRSEVVLRAENLLMAYSGGQPSSPTALD